VLLTLADVYITHSETAQHVQLHRMCITPPWLVK